MIIKDRIPVHTFTRTANINMVIGSTGMVPGVGVVPFLTFSIWYTNQSVYIWGNSSNYSVVSIPGYSDLAALFDEVQVDKVEMEIFATALENPALASNTGSNLIVLCTDYNDKNPPATNGDALQYADAKIIPLLTRSPYKETQVPKFLSYTLDSAGTAQASRPDRGYVRSNLDVEHFCRKGSIMAASNISSYYCFVFRIKYNCRVAK
jgi:hypothetical protein